MGIFWRILSSSKLWFGLFFIVVLVAAFHLILGRGIESSFTRQLLHQQEIIARAGASNIIIFFQEFGDHVAILAQLKSIEDRDVSDATAAMDAFVEQQRDTGLIGGVVLTDSHGIVQFNSNVLRTRDIGESLADRDYFVLAKNNATKGKYFIGEPVISRLGGSKGQSIIEVASPVYQNGVFTGVIASSVKMAPLVERFFGLMKISELTEVYLVDEQGDLLYSNSNPDAIGFNISEIFSEDKTLSDRIESVRNSAEGQFQTKNYLIAHSPILLGTQNWLLIISSPQQEAVNLIRPFYIHLAAIALVTAFTQLLFNVILTRKKAQ